MNPEHLFVLALATWRISNLLVNEGGPFEMFDWLRAQFDIRVEDGEKVLRRGSSNEVGKMLLCIYCTSMWVALALTLLYLLLPLLTFWLCVALSLSAVACVVDRYMEG